MLIAVAGGIGSGKSMVCKVLRVMGFDVYDCDIRAKELMDSSREIIGRIAEEISAECVDADGSLDRKSLAKIVFSDSAALARLNGIVHSAVRDDILAWVDSHNAGDNKTLFVETAIPYSSRIDRMVHKIWLVDAPEEMRIERVVVRNSLTDRNDARVRVEAQRSELHPCNPHPDTSVIINDGMAPVIPQILKLIGERL